MRFAVGIFWAVTLLCMLVSCNAKLDKDQFVSWIQDYNNGLHVTKNVNAIIFDLQYQPPSYLQLLNQSHESVNDSLQYYLLTIGVEGGAVDIAKFKGRDQAEVQRLQYYLSYNFQDDIFLEENGERFSCLLFHHEQALKANNVKSFTLAFSNEFPESEEAKLVIESEVFGSLPIKIKVKKSAPR